MNSNYLSARSQLKTWKITSERGKLPEKSGVDRQAFNLLSIIGGRFAINRSFKEDRANGIKKTRDRKRERVRADDEFYTMSPFNL